MATLIAEHYAKWGKNVKLYTFGSPRVGYEDTYSSIERRIGPENIYRVAHDLDPITYIAPFPYIHVQPKPMDLNNLTLVSPTGKLLSVANHDMGKYINTVKDESWNGLRNESAFVALSESLKKNISLIQ